MALTTGGIDGLEWGFSGDNRGLVYLGQSSAGVGQNTELGKYLNWLVYQNELMSRWGAGVSADVYNKQTPLNQILKTVAAEGQPIPIIYGAAQIGGQIFAMNYNTTTKKWTIGYILCLGEIEAVDTVLINGAAAVAGVTVDKYTGTTAQTVNTKLSTAIAGYNDNMVITIPGGNLGIAYIVVQYSDSHYDDWPRVTANVRGRKVFKASTGTTVYSENPALHLADLISSTKYGQGYTLDTASLLLAEQYCDETVVSEVRRKGYCIIDTPQDTSNWVEIMRGYAGCFVRIRGDTAFFTPDKAAASVMTITTSMMVEDSIVIKKLDSSEIPTVVRATYTDTTGTEFRERLCLPAKASGVDAGTTPWRESRIRLTGVTRHSQAHRECIERLNKATTTDLHVEWTMFDEGFQLEAGDVVTLTHTPYGLTSKTLRLIENPEQVSPGRWRIKTQEYSAAAYATTVVTDSAASDTGLPTTITPLVPTGLTANETLYQLKDSSWAVRLDISWTAPADSIVTGYTVEVKETVSLNLIWSANTTGTAMSSAQLQEGVGYTITVKAYNNLYVGPTATLVKSALVGKNALPTAPSAPIGSNNNGEVRLRWTASPDADVVFYEVRYYTTAQTWAAGTLLDQIGALTFSTRVPAPGSTWRFGIKSIDSVGQYSAAAIEVDVAVALSTSGVTTFYANDPPTALAIGDLWFDTNAGNKLHYATATGSGSWQVVQDSSAALAVANTKNTTYRSASASPPTSPVEGDLWIKSDDNNSTWRYASGSWVKITDTSALVLDSVVKTANFTATAGKRYPCNTTAGAFTMTLPNAPTLGDTVYFFDLKGTFYTNNLTVARAASAEDIMDLAESLICDVKNYSGGLMYVSAAEGWVLI